MAHSALGISDSNSRELADAIQELHARNQRRWQENTLAVSADGTVVTDKTGARPEVTAVLTAEAESK
jgi:hypothetical protein